MSKKTAVEWLVDKLSNYDSKMIELFDKEIEQAKEMEKQQQDELAIGFANWCLDENQIIYNDGKEILEIYKNKINKL